MNCALDDDIHTNSTVSNVKQYNTTQYNTIQYNTTEKQKNITRILIKNAVPNYLFCIYSDHLYDSTRNYAVVKLY